MKIVPMSVAVLLVFAGVPVFAVAPRGTEVIATPHNLAVSGGGGHSDISSASEGRVCIYCHTPHHANGEGPLWSRIIRVPDEYTPYFGTAAMKAVPGRPNLQSRLCLSCHDGTIALGQLGRGGVADPTLPAMPSRPNPRENANLGSDLGDDHPISFSYPYPDKVELRDPEYLRLNRVRLFGSQKYVECASCHDPHNNINDNFLVMDTESRHDALCTTCHDKAGWDDASAHRSETSIAADGCLSCHLPHTAGGRKGLLKYPAGADNCLFACHNASSAVDIASQFQRLYRHPVADPAEAGKHAVNEDLPVSAAARHVECADCHNPHQTGAGATALTGTLRAVAGVTAGGVATPSAAFVYEICFKCHSGIYADEFVSSVPPLLRPQRMIATYRQDQRFSSANPSVHPVTASGTGAARNSLRQEYRFVSRIECGDCHARHGSDHQFILVAGNEEGFPAAAPLETDLCFRCHDFAYLLDPLAPSHAESVVLHQRHAQIHLAPCSACHDPHGVPASMGATDRNNRYLINFDARHAGGGAVYDGLSTPKSCTTACHTSNPRTFP